MNKKYKRLKSVFSLYKYKKSGPDTLTIKGWNSIHITSNKLRIRKKVYKNGYRNFK